ncbi:MAG: glycosyltransferase family 4 protein [Prevotella sp.]|nr:glycosyltransferase family 4 protein [Prevotella sp.]
MVKNKVLLVIASQDFVSANHKPLWQLFSQMDGYDVIVANIPADQVVCRLRNKTYRIADAKKGPEVINEHLTVFRPLLTVRAEIAPSFTYPLIAKQMWNSIKKFRPTIMTEHVDLLVYNALWVPILKGTHPDMKIGYYLFDEVRNNGADNTIDKQRYYFDEIACKQSDAIFTMTKMLADSRAEYNSNIKVVGNGALVPASFAKPDVIFPKSIAFIGNLRDWFDEELFELLVTKRPDITFVFVGPVEDNMNQYLNSLLNKYLNVVYFGKVKKENMPTLYRMFSGVIIPYRKNPFIQATRPIKIVESVMSGTPVVSIPVDGYQEGEFIRFAKSVEEFSEQIDFIINNPIEFSSSAYKDFANNNSWDHIAYTILNSFKKDIK